MSWLDETPPPLPLILGITDSSLPEPPKRTPKPIATFALPLEEKQLVIDALYTWKSAYKKNFTRGYPQTKRDWKRIEKILKELEGE